MGVKWNKSTENHVQVEPNKSISLELSGVDLFGFTALRGLVRFYTND